LAHAIANDLATTELHLIPIPRLSDEIALDFDDEFRVREPHPVTDRGAKEFRVLPA
jgi:hypothetical protein